MRSTTVTYDCVRTKTIVISHMKDGLLLSESTGIRAISLEKDHILIGDESGLSQVKISESSSIYPVYKDDTLSFEIKEKREENLSAYHENVPDTEYPYSVFILRGPGMRIGSLSVTKGISYRLSIDGITDTGEILLSLSSIWIVRYQSNITVQKISSILHSEGQKIYVDFNIHIEDDRLIFVSNILTEWTLKISILRTSTLPIE